MCEVLSFAESTIEMREATDYCLCDCCFLLIKSSQVYVNTNYSH